MIEVIQNSLFQVFTILQGEKSKSKEMILEGGKVVPFLKWAGGKRQILGELEKHMPRDFNSYFEPFLGGGSFYFHLKNLGKIQKESYLSDFNQELINTYNCISESTEELMSTLEKMKKKHSKEYFYEVRGWDRKTSFKQRKNINRAARFIYLNKTCFNGIWRTNLKGENNVPFGNHMNPKLYDRENILACSRYLNQNTQITSGDFKEILKYAKRGDFVFLDPPYDPYSKTASFTTYNGARFCKEMQEKVYESFIELDRKGCFVMMTNNATCYIKELYKKYEKTSKNINVRRYVNCNGEKRDAVKEIIIKNY